MTQPRVAVVADLLEERWHSMDLVAEILLLGLRTQSARTIDAVQLRPEMVRRLTRVPLVGRSGTAETADRIINRMWDYGRWLAPQIADFDLFHIVDHSYAHLVTMLPPGRAIVSCHDIDAFEGLLPGTPAGSVVGRWLGERLLTGLVAARQIVCGSVATKDALLASGIVPASRLTVVPYGVHPTCQPWPDPTAERDVRAHLGDGHPDRPELLHVGSTIARKRIDVLLDVVAALRRTHPGLRLVRVGGPFTKSQALQVSRLGLSDHVTVMPFVSRRVLAALYRRAAVVLQPSEREGFGLPVAEAMACGTPVVASDLEALREVGGPAGNYCPIGDVPAWTDTVSALLAERTRDTTGWQARKASAMAHARQFDPLEHARRMTALYHELLPTSASGNARPALSMVAR